LCQSYVERSSYLRLSYCNGFFSAWWKACFSIPFCRNASQTCCNNRFISVQDSLSPSCFPLLPSTSFQWSSLPWQIALLLCSDLRGAIQEYCLPWRSQPLNCWAYKSFTEIIVCFNSFRGVAGTIDRRDLDRLSEQQAGLSVRRELWRSSVLLCFFGCGYMNAALWYGPESNEISLCQAFHFISQTYFGENCCMAVPVAWRREVWILGQSLQGIKMMFSEPRAQRRWNQEMSLTSLRAGAIYSHFFWVCLLCRHDIARAQMWKGAWT